MHEDRPLVLSQPARVGACANPMRRRILMELVLVPLARFLPHPIPELSAAPRLLDGALVPGSQAEATAACIRIFDAAGRQRIRFAAVPSPH